MNLAQKIKTALQSNNHYNYLIEKLSKYQVYVAGGFIRNLVLDKPVKDFDLFVNSQLSELSNFLEDKLEYGELSYGPFGSPRWKPTESEIYFDIVPFPNFIVNNKRYNEMSELLLDFDITINAVGYDIKAEKMIDPINGIADINHKIIRATHFDFPDFIIRDGENEISSLSVFWFRLVHYKSILEFRFEESTLDWIIKNRDRYYDLSKFKKMFFNPVIPKDLLKGMIR